MLSVNGRIRVELLLVRSKNSVLSRENYLPLAAHLNCYSQENFSCVSSSGYISTLLTQSPVCLVCSPSQVESRNLLCVFSSVSSQTKRKSFYFSLPFIWFH